MEYISENLDIINEKIAAATSDSMRDFHDVSITAVTKTVEPEKINCAVSLGIKNLGENKVQEFLEKKDFYDKTANIRFIGTLQSNKVKYLPGEINFIESVNSENLLCEINKRFAAKKLICDILIEINVADEPSKTGAEISLAEEIIKNISNFANVRLRGLMVMPPLCKNPEKYFDIAKNMFEKHKSNFKSKSILSMGTSEDYETAIKFGATDIRLGTALFGKRNYD